MANFFAKIFGGGNVSTDTPASAPKGDKAAENVIGAIQQLKEQEGQLLKRQELLEKRVAEELQNAKQLTLEKKRDPALLALKKKKMYQGELEKTDNMMLRVNEQIILLESQVTTAGVLGALHHATNVVQGTMKDVNIENVEGLIAGMNEVNDEMQLVNGALEQPLGIAADIDDEDLRKDWEELELAMLEEKLAAEAPVPGGKATATPLPAVPSTVPASTATLDDELAALEAEMVA